MRSPAQPFKTAQEAALRASAALLVACDGRLRLWTEPETKAVMPYILIGEDQVLPETTGCAGEAELVSTVQWWSRTPGALDKGAQARAMGAEIFATLNVALAIDGFEVVDWSCDSESYSTDPDGSTHGRAVFTYLLTEIAA